MQFTQNRNLMAIGLFVDVVLLILFGYCLVLGVYVAALDSTATPREPSPIVEEQTVVATLLPSRTPLPTPTLGPSPTITLIPTLPDTATPTNAVVEPTRVPYIFPNPLVVPGGSPATPTRTRQAFASSTPTHQIPASPTATPRPQPSALPSAIPGAQPAVTGPQ